MKQIHTNTEWTFLETNDAGCFACGKDNPYGLKMTFETNGEKLRSIISVPSRFKGWKNLVHGGIISTIIDESMAWGAACLTRRLILTRSMHIRFRKPVQIEKELLVYSHVMNRKSEAAVTMQADINDHTGTVCATGTGEFALFTPEEFLKLEVMDAEEVRMMAERLKLPVKSSVFVS